jgi:hypothetical protein
VTLLLQAAAFALGVWLAIRMIAALYLVLDLWYAIRTEYPRVIRGIAGWATVLALTAWLLPQSYRAALGFGLLAFLGFYLSLFVFRYPVLRALARQRQREESLPGG